MPEIKYLCYFPTWEDKIMDGELIVGNLHFEYNFVYEGEDYPGAADHILAVFSEEGARNHFDSHGIPNVRFLYNTEEL